jgi:hypothetical protein
VYRWNELMEGATTRLDARSQIASEPSSTRALAVLAKEEQGGVTRGRSQVRALLSKP